MRIAFPLAAAAAIAAAFVGWWCWWPHDERTEMVLHHQHGRVTAGSKFRVAIGSEWRVADQTLRAQFRPSYVLWVTGTPDQLERGGGKLGRTAVLVGDSEVSYRDRSWRNGVITLKLHDGRVTELVWHYPGPFYIDL